MSLAASGVKATEGIQPACHPSTAFRRGPGKFSLSPTGSTSQEPRGRSAFPQPRVEAVRLQCKEGPTVGEGVLGCSRSAKSGPGSHRPLSLPPSLTLGTMTVASKRRPVLFRLLCWLSSKESACNAGDAAMGRSLGREGPLEKGMATHSSILAWRCPVSTAPLRRTQGRKGRSR